MPIDVTKIESADWSPKVGSPGEIVEGLDDIAQAIRIIVTTPRGSDPHRPTFGCDAWRYLDLPVNVAIPNMIREASDAIQAWEPRATLKKVTATQTDVAWITLTVTWEALLSGVQATEVRYALASIA